MNIRKLEDLSKEELIEIIRHERDHIAQPRKMVPEGWKLVPIEPTKEMKTAAICAEVYQDSPIDTGGITWAEIAEIYKAMLAAAPTIKESLTVQPTDSEILDWLILGGSRIERRAMSAGKVEYRVIDVFGYIESISETAREAIIEAMRGEE